MKSPQLRWILWIGALVVLALLLLSDETPEGAVVEVAERSATQAAGTTATDVGLQWQRLAARAQTMSAVDLFQSAQQAPAADSPSYAYIPPPEVALVPAAPAAPFQYLGRLDVEPGKPMIFLTDGRRVYALTPGQQINNVWRLDRDEPQALYLTYLPMDIQQTISKSAAVTADEASQGVSG